MAERFFLAALALYIAVLPIAGTTALRSLAFVLLIALTAWEAARRRLRLQWPLWPAWAAYAGIALASLLYAADPAYTLGEIRAEIVYSIVIFVIAASRIRSPDQLERLVWLLAAGNLLFIAGSAWTAVRGGKDALGAWDTGVGATATVIVTALPWLAVLMLRSLAAGRRLAAALLGLLALANLGALSLTMNRQGWLALAAAFAVAAILAGRSFWTRRRALAAGAAVVLLLALAAVQFHSRAQSILRAPAVLALDVSAEVLDSDVRWQLWRFSLERIAERPWSGGGFGRESFKLLFADYHRAHPQLWHAHNMVINKGIQMGIPGMIAFLALWAALAAACAKGLRTPALRPWAVAALAMIAGVFVRNMADDFFVRDHAQLFWLLCGACLGALRQAVRQETGAA